MMDARRRAFYEYHAAMMEPWDGPAAMAFTDGRQIGATLDRNGLRPARYIVTDDDLVVMASESGVLPIPENTIVKKWRLQPGKMFLVDLEQGRIVDDEELKDTARLGQAVSPVDRAASASSSTTCRRRRRSARVRARSLLDRQQAFGYTQEDIKFLMAPMAQAGEEAHRLDGQRLAAGGAVGQEQAALQLLQAAVRAGHQPADRPDPRGARDVAGLVHRPEARTCSASTTINPPMRLEVAQPVLDFDRHGDASATSSATPTASSSRFELDITYPLAWGAEGDRGEARVAVRARADDAIRSGYNILIISRPPDRPRAASRSRRCWRCRRSTSTWCTRACARPPAWSSRPARRAKCTTSRCSPATAPKRSIPTSRSRRWPRCTSDTAGRARRPRRRSRTTSRRSARA